MAGIEVTLAYLKLILIEISAGDSEQKRQTHCKMKKGALRASKVRKHFGLHHITW